MMPPRARPLLALLLCLPAAPASAAERTVGVGSFDMVRIEGPFDVRIVTGGSPRASVSGDRDAIDAVDIRVEGMTLTVGKRGGDWAGDRGGAAAGGGRAPLTVTLSTTSLRSIALIGAGRVQAGEMKAARLTLSVTGTGEIAVAGARGEQLNATVIGSGGITVRGGTANAARLVSNGPARIDATAMEAGDLYVRLEGLGETRARARYTAEVSNTGLGQVVIAGSPKCTIRGAGGGPVVCGAAKP